MVSNTGLANFQKSITDELTSVRNRVRNLIGDANWGEEGRYKEAVLRSIIWRLLPSNISLGTGFVIKKYPSPNVSKQIDIIVYQNTYPLLFREGDFIITTPENVKGIIEVKTRLDFSKINDVITAATHNSKFLSENAFHGVFFYESPRRSQEYIRDHMNGALSESGGTINHICIGSNIFVKYWDEDPLEELTNSFYRFYRLENLAFSYFISNLITIVCGHHFNERSWFYFPLHEGKRVHKLFDIPIQHDRH